MEAERIEEESIRVNQANIAMQIDEAQKLKAKHGRQLKLKETLDQGKAVFAMENRNMLLRLSLISYVRPSCLAHKTLLLTFTFLCNVAL